MVDPEKAKLEEVQKPQKWLGIRHIQYALLFFAAIIGYGSRTVLLVAVYAIVDDDGPVDTHPEWADYKNVMISSFFWGYVCFQVGAGQIAKNYGPKLFLTTAMVITSVFSILIPVFGDQFGYGGVIACRVIQGLSQGFLFPSVHNLLGEWVPVVDRASVATFVYAGSNLGSAISMVITGEVSATIGWPVAFYIYGGVGLVWCVLFFIFGFDAPSKHPYISEEERKYIEFGVTSAEEKKSIPTPWKAMVTSLPVWAILIAHSGQNWGLWTLMSEMPSYMQKILDYDIDSNSELSALPYFVMWALSFAFGAIGDYTVKKVTSVEVSRKIFNSIGFFIPAIALVCLSFVNSDQRALTVGIFVVAVGFNSAIYCGFNVNHVDLSPTHAGTLMGITNTIANVFSILAPLAVDFVADATGYTESDKELWNIIFNAAAVFYVFVGAFFIFAGSGEEQPWNSPDFNKINRRHEEVWQNTQP